MKDTLKKLKYAMLIENTDDLIPKIKLKWMNGKTSYRTISNTKTENLWDIITAMFLHVPIHNTLLTSDDLSSRNPPINSVRQITSTHLYVNPSYILSIHSAKPHIEHKQIQECSFRPVYMPNSYIIVGLESNDLLTMHTLQSINCEYICSHLNTQTLIKRLNVHQARYKRYIE